MREGLELIRGKVVNVISKLSEFADRYKDLPTLGFTPLSTCTTDTVGKRASLWINELLMDLEEINFRMIH